VPTEEMKNMKIRPSASYLHKKFYHKIIDESIEYQLIFVEKIYEKL